VNNKKAWLENEQIVIKFPYDPDTIAEVKMLSGRRWHSETKTWTATLYIDNVKLLLDIGFSISDKLTSWYAKITLQPEIGADEIVIPGLKRKLKPYQNRAVRFINTRDGRALIADQQGLGKTIEALAWLQLHKHDALPAMIVCPASLKLNWERETKAWTTLTPTIWSGRNGKGKEGYIGADVHIMNYDILADTTVKDDGRKDVKLREDIAFFGVKTVIMDESQSIRNRTAQRTKAALQLCKQAKNIIALTGTPIVNRPIEIFNTLSAIAPGLFPSFWKFAMRYCGAKHTGFGWNFNGSSNSQELHEKLISTVMLRRLKADVLPELPAKQRIIVPMEIDNWKEYDRAVEDIIAYLQGIDPEKAERAESIKALARFETLKQLTAKGKLTSVIDWIENFLSNDEKLVVGCTHYEITDALMQKFSDVAVKMDGRDDNRKRQLAVDRFQTDDTIRLIIGNLEVIGVGWTLTAASSTATVELGWTTGSHLQFEDRVHRIGQEADSVNSYYLIAANTIEEDILELLMYKEKNIDAIVDGIGEDTDGVFSTLLKRLRPN
jgi:SWI/SNF-related matrix-associated actin-dependent regulator of chromatin subfamily A-like protein 1